MDPRVTKAKGLLEQAAYLASPHRKSGPSVEEAADSVAQMRREADELLCDAFYFRSLNEGKRERA
jgi:hypothetical protein